MQLVDFSDSAEFTDHLVFINFYYRQSKYLTLKNQNKPKDGVLTKRVIITPYFQALFQASSFMLKIVSAKHGLLSLN